MRRLIFLTLIVLFVWACSSSRGIVKVEKEFSTTKSDSLEYDIETFDARFDSWYVLHNSPAAARSLQYYENWNHQYVIAWNEHAMRMGRNSFFEPIAGYDPSEDYGFEFNHKLFYYFQYVENVLKIQIMPGGPKSIPL